MKIHALISAVVFGLILSTIQAQAEPFAFQGQLNDQGAPAEGLYDLEFVLYGMDIGGTQIGPTVTLEDQPVTNGIFNVELDFGDVFDGSARWIEVGVRNGDSIDAFTQLNPRLKVGSAPQASYATKSGIADTLTNPFWTQAPGILFFGDDGGHDQFFFNRNRVIDPTDVMVVQSNQNGFGGFTLSTWTAGMPYFGYATGGFTRARTYYDPVTDAWVVNKGGDQLEIDANNDVIITNNLIVGGTISSADGSGGAMTGYRSFTPDLIFVGGTFDRTAVANAGAIVVSGNSYLRVDLDLPHGATITTVQLQFWDSSGATNLLVKLSKRDMSTLDFTIDTLGSSSGSSGSVQVLSLTPDPGIVIDNTAYTYQLRCFSSSGGWPSIGSLGVRSILIGYTLP